MAYYNIYKIIKDILRTIFGNKLFRLALLALICGILLCFVSDKVQAVDVVNNDPITFTYNNTNYSNDTFNVSEYNHFFITTNRNNTSFVIYQSKNDLIFTITNNYLRTKNVSSSNDIYYYVVPIESFNSYNFSNFNYGSHFTSNFEGSTYQGETHYILSNYNVYIDNYVFNKNSDIYTYIYPSFDNITEIKNGYPDGVIISRGSYSEDETLYFHLLKITNTINDGTNTIYYYSPKIFALNKDSKYYRTYDADTENKYSYYYINRSALTLDTNSSYLYLLSNSSESYTNSYGILQPDYPAGIYDVIQSDTTGVITSQDSTNDKIQNIDDTLNDNSVSSDTETNIEDSLKFDNKNDGLNNLNNGFFSRLTSMLSNLLGYNLSDDTSVSIPFPNSEKHLILHSKDIHDHVNGAIRVIINAFWIYIFTYYLWKFINKIYISVSSGNILDSFSSSDEAITNNML